MKKIFLLLLFLSSFVFGARAQSVGSIQGFCDIGGKVAMTSGLPSSNYLQGIIPNCTVTVYLTGTTTKPANIYSDQFGTVLGNPFKASVIGLINTGKWTFFSTINQGVDVILSGGNAPLTFPSPVAWGVDLFPGMVTPGVTSILPGTNITCTPLVGGSCTGNVTINALSSMVWPPAGLAASTGTSGPWRAAVYTDLTALFSSGSCNGFLNSSGTCSQPTTFQHNGTNLPVQSLLNFLDATPSLPSGGTPVNWTNDSGGGLGGYVNVNVADGFQTQVVPPLTTQYVVIYPTASVTSTNPLGCGTGSITANDTSGLIYYIYGGSGNCIYNITWSGFTLPSYVVAANVTSVYSFIVSSNQPQVTSNIGSVGASCTGGSGMVGPFTGWPMQQFTSSTSLTGTTLTSATCSATVDGSVIGAKTLINTISSVGLIVFYTGTAPPANTNYQCVAPFYCNPSTLQMGVNLPFDIALDGGAANVLAASVAGYSGLIPGQTIKVRANHATTTTTPTFNLNGFGALTIVGPTGSALSSGDINTTVTAILMYSNAKWYLQNPQASSSGGTSSYAVSVTQAPYSAKCDGTTDDHVAIQSALDNNAAVYIPYSLAGTVCDIGTVGLTINNPGEAFYGNAQFLKYDGSGAAVAWNNSNIVYGQNEQIRDTIIQFSTASASHIAFSTGNADQIDFVNDGDEGDTTANCTSIKNTTGGSNILISNYNGSCGFNLITSATASAYSIVSSFSGGNSRIDGNEVALVSSFFNALTLGTTDATNATLDQVTAAITLGAQAVTLNGSTTSGSSLTGVPAAGVFSNGGVNTNYGPVLAGIIYSAAGTPLPSCTSGNKSAETVVSDATGPTFLATYTSGGAVLSPVVCNGTNWKTY